SMIPFRSSISIARSATAAAMVSNLSGSGDQSILVADAKCDIGCASTPTLAILIFLHSTIVVPVSQNGSRTHALAPNSNRLIYLRKLQRLFRQIDSSLAIAGLPVYVAQSGLDSVQDREINAILSESGYRNSEIR